MNLSSMDDHGGGCFNIGCTDGGNSTATSSTTTASAYLGTLCHFPSSSNFDAIGHSHRNDTNQLVSDDMNHSLSERDQVYEDIHGVRQVMDDDNERIISALRQMDIELLKLKTNSTAYCIAEQMSLEYVTNIKFRIRFLRTSRYDPILASIKFLRHFEQKLILFGKDKLTKSITLSDLTEDDMSCLISGKFQLLPFRDRSGRAVIVHLVGKKCPIEQTESMLRSFWYFLMSVAEDEETQRRGVVVVIYAVGNREEDFNNSNKRSKMEPHKLKFGKGGVNVARSLPIRFSCIHCCFNESRVMTILASLLNSLLRYNRTITRLHHGSVAECNFSLMTFGIPLHALPITGKGEYKIDSHYKYIQSRTIIERTAQDDVATAVGIYLPDKNDVLFGRGRPIQNHLGNEYLRQLIKESYDEYQNARSKKKKLVCQTIISNFKAKYGGHFLKQQDDSSNNSGLWMEVSNDIVMQKVSAGFRTVRSDKKLNNTNNDTIKDYVDTNGKRMKKI